MPRHSYAVRRSVLHVAATASIAIAGAVLPLHADTNPSGPLTLTTEDDRTVTAAHYGTSIPSPPALVMVSNSDDASDAWEAFAREAADHGIAVVALRLTADSSGGTDEERLDASASEIRAAVRYVREREDIDGVRVALLATDEAANVAAHYATGDQLLVGLGLLSPAEAFGALGCADAVTEYGQRPLLLAGGRSPDARSTVATLESAARGDVRLVDAGGNQEGAALLGQFQVRASLLEWLDGVFQEL